MNLKKLTTEQQNLKSRDIDRCQTTEILHIINEEDQYIAAAVKSQIPVIAQAVDKIVAALHRGGRLIYIGAGTSGRLGILDATECPPTYGTPPEQVVGLIAGGHEAMFRSVENAEDNEALAVVDLQSINLSGKDVLVGIAASGRTPYVLAALRYARRLGTFTVGLSCTEENPLQTTCELPITPIVGAEVITGSTRMKAGTAQKMVLNMLTTATMVRLGKVYRNLMVDVKPANEKLVQRQKNIICDATGCTETQAIAALAEAHGEAKTAIVMLLLDLPADTARLLLAQHHGHIYQVIKENAAL